MRTLALAVLVVTSLPALAFDACSVLNQIEIAATLRGRGVVVPFQGKTNQEKSSVCSFARISKAGTFEESLQRFKSEAPLTLMVALAENVGSNTIDAVKAQIQNQVTETEVPGVGDRASFFRAAKSDSLLVARGSEILTLRLLLKEPTERRRQDLLSLAREALASDFDGWKVVKYEVAERALTDDRGTFEMDPKNFAALLAVMRKFDEARTYNLRALTALPGDADALYLQGVLDWVVSYQQGVQLRSQLGLAPWQSLEGPACAKIRSANLEKVNEGLEMLSKAVKLRPDFDEAMSYTALLYREHADYQCGQGATRSTDLRTADEWFDKARASKQANVGKNRTLYGLALFLPPPPPPDLLSPPRTANTTPTFSAPPLNSPDSDSVAIPNPIGGIPIGMPAGQRPLPGVIGGIVSSTPVTIPKAGSPSRVRVSLGVSQGLLIKKVDPTYPPLARQARVQGTVLLQTEINEDGTVETLRLISGHPMLAPAAIEAAKQWRYKPYILNGRPVAVETQVQVNFNLSKQP